MADKAIKVVQFGVGPIGLECVKVVLDKQSTGKIDLCGIIDVDPNKVGRDVGALLGTADTGLVVRSDASDVLSEIKPDVVLHTTSSFLDGMADQLVLCATNGCNVVSSTEELSYPYYRHPKLAARLDSVAKENGVTFLGTGVNPGYAMDALALMATGVSTDVSKVTVRRIVDAGQRRKPLQMKVGAGISEKEFYDKKATGKFGHIGLQESLYMIADGLGWRMDSVDEQLNPVISQKTVETPFLTVNSGDVAGIHHSIVGSVNGRNVIELHLQMYVGAEGSVDWVQVDGIPPMDLRVHGGIFGDTATIAALVNGVPLVLDAEPGLKTVKDLPVSRAFATTV